MFATVKPLFLTVVFGTGKIISTIGSNFFGLDKTLEKIGIKHDSSLGSTLKYSGAISGGVIIALTRTPAMWNQFSHPKATIVARKNHPKNAFSRNVSITFGSMGFIAGILAGLSSFLGGYTLAQHAGISSDTILDAFSYYTLVCSVVSFSVYSVTKVINSSYDLTFLFFEDNKINKVLKKDNIATLIATSFCIVSSITMFYFSSKHSLPLFVQRAFNYQMQDDKYNKIFAAISVLPSEATYIFSQIVAVKNFFADKTNLLDGYKKNNVNNILISLLLILSVLAIANQFAGYYVFMDEMLKDIGITNTIALETLSILSSASSGLIFYVFNARPAIKQSITLMKEKYTCSSNKLSTHCFSFWKNNKKDNEGNEEEYLLQDEIATGYGLNSEIVVR